MVDLKKRILIAELELCMIIGASGIIVAFILLFVPNV
jgi:hypothetical protein